jgi:hypothetical protein
MTNNVSQESMIRREGFVLWSTVGVRESPFGGKTIDTKFEKANASDELRLIWRETEARRLLHSHMQFQSTELTRKISITIHKCRSIDVRGASNHMRRKRRMCEEENQKRSNSHDEGID